jgi:hypothetical protein
VNCKVCSDSLTHKLDLVKDGTVYRAFSCASGHHLVRDTRQDHLPVELETQDGVQVARVKCGDNSFIFDRRMFRSALRHVFRAVRRQSGNLVLDLSRVSLVGDGLLSAVKSLDNGLVGQERSMVVVAPSAAVQSDLLSAAPRLTGRIYRRPKDALAASSGAEKDPASDKLAMA